MAEFADMNVVTLAVIHDKIFTHFSSQCIKCRKNKSTEFLPGGIYHC